MILLEITIIKFLTLADKRKPMFHSWTDSTTHPHLAWSMDAPNYRTIDFVDVENKKFIKQVEGHIFYWMTRIREYGQ